jgi:hypothetical protein
MVALGVVQRHPIPVAANRADRAYAPEALVLNPSSPWKVEGVFLSKEAEMKGRNFFGLMLSVVLLLLAAGSAGSGQAHGPQEAVAANASSAVNAPWFNIEVDTPGDTGQYTSVAIDPVNGITYVSYYDATNEALRMAMNGGFGSGGNCGPDNSWFCQTLDSGIDVGKYSSIAIKPASGATGIYHPEIGVTYYDATSGKLKYVHGAICATCSWSIDTVDQPILFPTDNKGQYTSLKYASSGTPYIAYYFENTSGVDALKVASPVSSGGNCGYGSVVAKWQCDTIRTGEGVGQYASLALDGAGNRHIAYHDGGNDALWYAYEYGGSWTIREILPTNSGQYASLYVDVDNGDLPHIAHYDSSNGKLRYAVPVASGGTCGFNNSTTKFEWQCDDIESVGTGTHPKGVSLAVDGAGHPIIAYQSENGSLNVARPVAALGLPGGGGNCGPESTWYCETIDRSGKWIPYRNGDYVSIAVNSAGLATIAYNGFVTSSDGNLNVSYQQFQVVLPLVTKSQ